MNARNWFPGMAFLTEKLLGISASRPLPVWRSKGFRSKSKKLVSSSLQECDLVLWADTFNDAYAPETLIAAYELASGMGYKVALSGAAAQTPLCCGRTSLSVGQIDEAKAMALQCLSALEPAIARGVPIVGLEPSCILSLRDEWLVMQLGDKAKQLSKQAMLFEEWWMKEITQGGIQKSDALKGQSLYVHGHCHQKALGAMSPTIEALKSLGADVKLIESSCCGMAGSFGYDAKHQTVSKAMAQLSLVPAVNAAPEDALIVADGFSCQHQIADLSARKAQHAVLVMHQAVKSGRSKVGH